MLFPWSNLLPRRTALRALGAVIALGLLLRLLHLGEGLRIDEAETWSRAQWPLSWLWISWRFPHLYALTDFASRVLGDGEFGLRLPHVLYGVLSLPVVYLLGRALFDEETGVWACLLTALSVFHIRYSQELRHYAPLMFYSLCSLFCLLRALDPPRGAGRRRFGYWAGFAAFQLLNLSLHPFALYPLALCAAWTALHGVLHRRAGPRRIRSALYWSGLGAAALALCLLPFVPAWRGLFKTGHLQGVATMAVAFLRYHYLPEQAWLVLPELLKRFSGGAALGALYLALAVLGAWMHRRGNARSLALIGLWIALPLVSLFVVRVKIHFEPRYFIFVLPVFLILSAAGLSALTRLLARGPLRGWTGVLLMVVFLLGCHAPVLRDYYALPRSGWREAIGHLNRNCRPGDAVLVFPWKAPDDQMILFQYYPVRGECVLYSAVLLSRGFGAYAPLLRAYPRIWLAATWIDDPIRRREFDALLRHLEPSHRPQARLRFRARNPNDSVQLHLFNRESGPPVLPSGLRENRFGGRPAEDPWNSHPRRDFLLANIPETARSLGDVPDFVLRTIHQSAPSAALLRIGPGRDSGPLLAQTGGRIYYVWSGSVSVGGSRGRVGMRRGDLLFVPAQARHELRGAPPEGAILLGVGIPAGTEEPQGTPRRPRIIANVFDGPAAGSAVGKLLVRVPGMDVLVTRLLPGDGPASGPSVLPGASLQLVVEGLAVKWVGNEKSMGYELHYFEGDFSRVGLRPGKLRSFGAGPAVLLHFVPRRGGA